MFFVSCIRGQKRNCDGVQYLLLLFIVDKSTQGVYQEKERGIRLELYNVPRGSLRLHQGPDIKISGEETAAAEALMGVQSHSEWATISTRHLH